MLPTFWFLFKLGLFIALLSWLLSLQGSVLIAVETFTLSAPFGLFIVILLAGFWGLSLCIRAIKTAITAPQKARDRHHRKAMQKGLQSFAQALSAIAQNDLRLTNYHIRKMSKYLKDDYGLTHWLGGYAHHHFGNASKSRQSFEAALDHKDIAMAALSNLFHTAMDKHDFRYARALLDRMSLRSPNNTHIEECFLTLNKRTGHFAKGLDNLKILRKNDRLTKNEAQIEKSFLLYGMGEVEKAYKMNPASLPLSLAYLKHLLARHQRRKAIALIKKQWAVAPHPDLINGWIQCAPAPKKKQNASQSLENWILQLHNAADNTYESSLYCAQAMITHGLKDMAQTMLNDLIKVSPSALAYELLNTLDPMAGWHKHILNAPTNNAWVCHETGEQYKTWQLLTDEAHFNSLRWTNRNVA